MLLQCFRQFPFLLVPKKSREYGTTHRSDTSESQSETYDHGEWFGQNRDLMQHSLAAYMYSSAHLKPQVSRGVQTDCHNDETTSDVVAPPSTPSTSACLIQSQKFRNKDHGLMMMVTMINGRMMMMNCQFVQRCCHLLRTRCCSIRSILKLKLSGWMTCGKHFEIAPRVAEAILSEFVCLCPIGSAIFAFATYPTSA